MEIPNRVKNFFNDEPIEFDFRPKELLEVENDSQLGNWVVNKSKWPYLPLVLPEAPYTEMLSEAQKLKDLFVNHRIEDNLPVEYNNKGWASVCLHGEEWNKTESFNQYPEHKGKTDQDIEYKWCEEITSKCPITTDYFKKSFPAQEYYRVRFMYLEPNGYIQPHRDRDHSMLFPVNIALNNPEGCIFRMKDKGDVPFNPKGGACLVDISNTHSVWNNSDTARIHIIVHFKQDSRFNNVIVNSLHAMNLGDIYKYNNTL